MKRPIVIKDYKGKEIAQQLCATETDILTYIAKGFTVIDRRSGEIIQESDVTDTVGIADGDMIMG